MTTNASQVDEALNLLAAAHSQCAEIVRLRVFTSLQVGEIAALLGCSEKAAQREWTCAKAGLSRELNR